MNGAAAVGFALSWAAGCVWAPHGGMLGGLVVATMGVLVMLVALRGGQKRRPGHFKSFGMRGCLRCRWEWARAGRRCVQENLCGLRVQRPAGGGGGFTGVGGGGGGLWWTRLKLKRRAKGRLRLLRLDRLRQRF